MEFIDLKAQYRALKDEIDKGIEGVLTHGRYIMGPEVAQLETELAAYVGRKYCITCANGTDALQMALMAFGIGVGDAVFVPSFTFMSTAEVVSSMMRIPGCTARARARAIRCFWPPERPTPRSPTMVS